MGDQAALSEDVPPPLVLVGAPRLTSTPGNFPSVDSAVLDSVLDGGAVDGLTVRAASLRGDDHRFYGDTRQDAFGIWPDVGTHSGQPALAICVADGVGSEPLSHIGATAACRHLPAALEQHVSALLDPTAEYGLTERIGLVIKAISARLQTDAEARVVDPRRLSTTLVAAVFGARTESGRRAVFFRVGDSPAYTLRRGTFEPSFVSTDSLVTTVATAALPMNIGTIEIAVATVVPGDVVVLCTDGLSGPLASEAVQRQLATWWRADPPDLAEFYWQMSFRAQSYGDDRSAVCVWIA